MVRIRDLIGVESELSQVGLALRHFAEELSAPVVGAYQVTCSDEVEWECAEAFQEHFCDELLPILEFERRSPFRSINLGARYEWGAIRVAEEHFATESSQEAFKLLVAKINAHVAVEDTRDGPVYGGVDRYGRRSTCCGALAGLFEGSLLPAIQELRQIFQFGGLNRLSVLADRSRIAPEHRALLAAVVSARLQAHRVVLDIEEYRPESPTVFLILPCVTLNRLGRDTELVVGQYGVDRTEPTPRVKYVGLGDAPASYRIGYDQGRLIVEDDRWPETSEAE